jgi:hypothetical protein
MKPDDRLVWLVAIWLYFFAWHISLVVHYLRNGCLPNLEEEYLMYISVLTSEISVIWLSLSEFCRRKMANKEGYIIHPVSGFSAVMGIIAFVITIIVFVRWCF